MSSIYLIKEQITAVYSKWSRWIDVVLRFLVNVSVFLYINSALGYMDQLNNNVLLIGLAVITAFFPLTITAILTVAIVLAHLSALNLLLTALVGGIFFLLFVTYFRFSAKGLVFLLLTPVAFHFEIQYILPVVVGLVGTVSGIMPLACGAALYFLILFVQDMAVVVSTVEEATKVANEAAAVVDAKATELQTISTPEAVAAADPAIAEAQTVLDTATQEATVAQEALAKVQVKWDELESGGVFEELLEQIVFNKELWVELAMLAIGVCVVIAIKKVAIPNNWKIAMASGIATNFIIMIFGAMMFGFKIPLQGLLIGNICALAVGFILEVLFLGVDYNRTENLEFEDDEYYYYVKAVPKVHVAKPEKMIKKVNSAEKKKAKPAPKNRQNGHTRVIGNNKK